MEQDVALGQRWISVLDMPRAVAFAATVALDGKILVIGGTNSEGEDLSAVLEYNPGDGSWKDLPSLLTARPRCAACVLGVDAVVMGGRMVVDGVSMGLTG